LCPIGTGLNGVALCRRGAKTSHAVQFASAFLTAWFD
jgi:hypothetical protein